MTSIKAQRRQATQKTFSELESIEALCRHLEIPPHTVDFLLAGDGSGTSWDKAVGWAATLIDFRTFDRTIFSGGASAGTNNVAELMAYFMPLQWLVTQAKHSPRGLRVRILSDSQYIVDGFNGVNQARSHRELWQALLSVKHRGLRLQAHWIPRGCVPLNKLADGIAGQQRLRQEQIVAQIAKSPVSVYELNPFLE